MHIINISCFQEICFFVPVAKRPLKSRSLAILGGDTPIQKEMLTKLKQVEKHRWLTLFSASVVGALPIPLIKHVLNFLVPLEPSNRHLLLVVLHSNPVLESQHRPRQRQTLVRCFQTLKHLPDFYCLAIQQRFRLFVEDVVVFFVTLSSLDLLFAFP